MMMMISSFTRLNRFSSCSFSTASSLLSRHVWPPLISASNAIALSKIKDPACEVIFLDGSFFLDKARTPRLDFLNERIPGSIYFDINKVCDMSTNLPHMLPTSTEFEEQVGLMGISNNDAIIVYESGNCFGAPRVWWTFRTFSHSKIAFLQGGLSALKKEGGAVETGKFVERPPKVYKATLKRKLVSSKEDVLDVALTGKSQIVDARSAGRFYGKVPEPRQGKIPL